MSRRARAVTFAVPSAIPWSQTASARGPLDGGSRRFFVGFIRVASIRCVNLPSVWSRDRARFLQGCKAILQGLPDFTCKGARESVESGGVATDYTGE
jgi:hypothetical protein